MRLETLGFRQVYDYVPGKMDWFASGLPREGKLSKGPYASDVVRQDVPTCGLTDRIDQIQSRVRTAGWNVCLVLADDRSVLGLLETETLEAAPGTIAEQVMELGPSTFRPSIPLAELSDYLREAGLDRAIITTLDGKLVGLVTRADAERRLDEQKQAAGQPD